MGMVDVGVRKAGFRDIPRVSWLIAGAIAGTGASRWVLRGMYFPSVVLSLMVGPAFLWTDSSKRMVVGFQSAKEYKTQLLRTLLLSLLVGLLCCGVLIFVFSLIMEPLGEYFGLILLALLALTAGVLAYVGSWQVQHSSAMRALKPWKDSPAGFRYVSGLAASPDMTHEELVDFVNYVILDRLPEGTCLGVTAMAPNQLGFFQGLGFSQLGTTLALLGHVPARTVSVPDHGK